MKKIKAGVLVSGGFDSAVLAGDLARRGFEVHPLYLAGGLRWEKAELHWLRRYLKAIASPGLKPLTVLDVPLRGVYGHHWSFSGRVPAEGSAWDSVYLPGRNLILLSQAAAHCVPRGITTIAMAVLKGNPFKDATPAFRAAMARAFSEAFGRRVRVIAPYAALSKERVARRGRGLPLHLTLSCLAPRGLAHCGKCTKCEERRAAF